MGLGGASVENAVGREDMAAIASLRILEKVEEPALRSERRPGRPSGVTVTFMPSRDPAHASCS